MCARISGFASCFFNYMVIRVELILAPKYVIRMLRTDLLEEVRRCKYLGTLITGKNEISEEIKMRITYCRQCSCDLWHIFKSRSVSRK
jgi:hypothetical protein